MFKSFYVVFTTISSYVELTSVMFKSLEPQTRNPKPETPNPKPHIPYFLLHIFQTPSLFPFQTTISHICLFIKQTPSIPLFIKQTSHYLIHKTNSLILFIEQIHQSDTSTFSSSLETSSFSLNSSSTASSVASSVRSSYS